MIRFGTLRPDIISDVLINISSAWLILIFIEPRLNSQADLISLIIRLINGILTLLLANAVRNLSDSA